jgi:hypothetical protein
LLIGLPVLDSSILNIAASGVIVPGTTLAYYVVSSGKVSTS